MSNIDVSTSAAPGTSRDTTSPLSPFDFIQKRNGDSTTTSTTNGPPYSSSSSVQKGQEHDSLLDFFSSRPAAAQVATGPVSTTGSGTAPARSTPSTTATSSSALSSALPGGSAWTTTLHRQLSHTTPRLPIVPSFWSTHAFAARCADAYVPACPPSSRVALSPGGSIPLYWGPAPAPLQPHDAALLDTILGGRSVAASAHAPDPARHHVSAQRSTPAASGPGAGQFGSQGSNVRPGTSNTTPAPVLTLALPSSSAASAAMAVSPAAAYTRASSPPLPMALGSPSNLTGSNRAQGPRLEELFAGSPPTKMPSSAGFDINSFFAPAGGGSHPHGSSHGTQAGAPGAWHEGVLSVPSPSPAFGPSSGSGSSNETPSSAPSNAPPGRPANRPSSVRLAQLQASSAGAGASTGAGASAGAAREGTRGGAWAEEDAKSTNPGAGREDKQGKTDVFDLLFSQENANGDMPPPPPTVTQGGGDISKPPPVARPKQTMSSFFAGVIPEK